MPQTKTASEIQSLMQQRLAQFDAILSQIFFSHLSGVFPMPPYNQAQTQKQASSGQKIARLTNINNEQFIKLETPYHKEFVLDLKSSIPSIKRSYMATEKYWIVTYDQLQFIITLCEKYFHDTLLFGFPEMNFVDGNCFNMLYLLPNAPKEVIKASYRTLASKYHPDRPDGDEEKMSALNRAYKKCLECFEKKTTDWRF